MIERRGGPRRPRIPRAVDTGVVRYLNIDTATRISKIGLGTWQFGSSEWGYGKPYAEQVAQAIVRRAIELGVTLFDTAEATRTVIASAVA